MHFMHAAQMISLLNVYMLITESSFYSLTLKLNAKSTNIFKLKITLKCVSEESSFAEVTEFKTRNVENRLIHQIETKKRKSTWFWKILTVEEVLKNNINNHSTIESLKSKIKHRKSKIVFQSLTSVSQRLKAWIQTMKTADFKKKNWFSVYWAEA